MGLQVINKIFLISVAAEDIALELKNCKKIGLCLSYFYFKNYITARKKPFLDFR